MLSLGGLVATGCVVDSTPMVWYGMVLYGIVWYGIVWYRMVWHGMVRHGMVWHGMVWHGMAGMEKGGHCRSDMFVLLQVLHVTTTGVEFFEIKLVEALPSLSSVAPKGVFIYRLLVLRPRKCTRDLFRSLHGRGSIDLHCRCRLGQ